MTASDYIVLCKACHVMKFKSKYSHNPKSRGLKSMSNFKTKIQLPTISWGIGGGLLVRI